VPAVIIIALTAFAAWTIWGPEAIVIALAMSSRRYLVANGEEVHS
jgi:hypothetical protein